MEKILNHIKLVKNIIKQLILMKQFQRYICLTFIQKQLHPEVHLFQ